MYNIHGYYDRGKLSSIIGQFVHPVGGEGIGRGNRYFSQLQDSL